MNRCSIVLQAANPTFEEGLACSRYLDEAAEGLFRFMLGPAATQIIAKAYPQPDHSYSFQNVTYAERDEVIVGMAPGFTAERHRSFSNEPLKKAAGSHALRMRVVEILSAPLSRVLKTIPAGDLPSGDCDRG